MDYITKPVSRAKLRTYSLFFRELFDVPEEGPFPVLESLEKLPDVFEGSTYSVVEDDAMPYEETKGMSVSEITKKYHVSKGFAKKRQKY